MGNVNDRMNRVPKFRGIITTVDPSQRLIEVSTPDGGMHRLAVFDVPAAFTWPKQGESWSVYEQNGNWYLGDKFLDPEEDVAFRAMQPGESRIISGGGGNGYDTLPIGATMSWTRTTLPEGYVLANGQSLTKAAYPQGWDCAKAEADGGNTQWTYDGTSFTVPNLANKFLYSSGVKSPGDVGGAETHTLTVGQLPDHNHNTIGGWGAGANFRAQMGTNLTDYGVGNTAYSTLETNGASPSGGRGQAHNNLPPYIVLALLVKVAGVTASASIIQGPPGAPGSPGAPGAAKIGDFTAYTNYLEFASIPGTYKHLQVRWVMQSSRSGFANTGGRVQINGITTATYGFLSFYEGGLTPTRYTGESSWFAGTMPANSRVNDNYVSQVIIDFPFYAKTDTLKTMSFASSGHDGTNLLGAGGSGSNIAGTSAITSILLRDDVSGTLATRMKAELWGIL